MIDRLKRLKQLPCCQCGYPTVDIAHSNFGEHGKGMGTKADDRHTIPLCRSCHQNFDWYSDFKREQAKAWFLDKLAYVDSVLNEDDRQAF